MASEPKEEITAVVESALYVDDLDRAEAFYQHVLGLEVIGREAGRHVFFRVGDGVLLLFDPRATERGDILPAHGAIGPGHLAFGIPTESFDAWRERLTRQSVAIERELKWARGGRSLYFRDPARNSLELITRGVWGLPSGW